MVRTRETWITCDTLTVDLLPVYKKLRHLATEHRTSMANLQFCMRARTYYVQCDDEHTNEPQQDRQKQAKEVMWHHGVNPENK